MKTKNSVLFSGALLAALLVIAIIACNRTFDAPPPYAPPGNIQANTTIKALKAMHKSGNYDSVSTDIVISGIVVADDESGNIYKEIFLQDSTGGICVLLNRSYLYGDYPAGRELYIKCKGLWLSDYGKCIQLGYIDRTVPSNPASTGIPSSLFDNYLVKGTLGNTVTPKIVTIAQLNNAATAANSNPSSDALQSTLIQIATAQFSDVGLIYADTSANKLNVSRTIADCSGATTVAYTSGYADFAGVLLPAGGGSITAVYIPYNKTSELLIRDTSDVKFTGARCNGTGGGTGTGNNTVITVAQLRAMYSSANVTVGNYVVRGVVISDVANKNLATGNVVIQNAGSGITLYFGSDPNPTINVGDSIEVNITGGTLQSYQGALEVSLNSSTPITKLATGVTVTPVTLTAAQINSQIANVEYTLVKIVGTTVPAGTYSGNKTLTDATGTLTLYTASAATFAGETLPTVSSDWVGYPSRFNSSVEFQIRNLKDVTNSTSGGGTTPPPSSGNGIDLGSTSPLTLNFDDIANGLPAGVAVYNSATSSSLGTAATFGTAKASWAATGAGFKNLASATDLSVSSAQADQDASTNRAIGVRQTGTAGTGGDPGASFVFQLDNTTGKTNLVLSFLLQSLDNSVGRTITWTVDYATGDNPTSFTAITTSPATLQTNPTWGSTAVTANLPSALNNQSGKVWIRISTLTASTGSSTRPTTAIDDVKFSWQ